jgi:hypothetical protein
MDELENILCKGIDESFYSFICSKEWVINIPAALTTCGDINNVSPLQYGTVDFSDLKTLDRRTHKSLTPNPPTKENTMKQINITVLASLANAEQKDEFSTNIANMPEPLKAALAVKRDAQAAKVWEDAATLILSIYESAQEQTQTHVQKVREARKQEAQHLAKIATINRAKAYGEATNNYLPLAALCGNLYGNVDTLDTDKFKVPEDWVDPTQVKKAKSANIKN